MSSFKDWLTLLEKEQLDSIVNGKGLILFFTKGNKVWGAPEHSRLVFAKLKNPDDDDVFSDLGFPAFDLAQALLGNKIHNMFSAGDLPSINIISKEDAEKKLSKKGRKKKHVAIRKQ
jgi:hypothetical protein